MYNRHLLLSISFLSTTLMGLVPNQSTYGVYGATVIRGTTPSTTAKNRQTCTLLRQGKSAEFVVQCDALGLGTRLSGKKFKTLAEATTWCKNKQHPQCKATVITGRNKKNQVTEAYALCEKSCDQPLEKRAEKKRAKRQ